MRTYCMAQETLWCSQMVLMVLYGAPKWEGNPNRRVYIYIYIYIYIYEVAQSCLTLCNPMGCSLPGSSDHGIFPGKSTGVGCHFLFQGIFPTQGLNPGLPPRD